MSKTCKDFGEVLVALGQGKTVINTYEHHVKLERGQLKYRKLAYGNDDWDILPPLVEEEFDYPAPMYEEPKTVEVDVWLNVYEKGLAGLIYLSRERADKYASSHRIACINIKRTVTEGEGLFPPS